MGEENKEDIMEKITEGVILSAVEESKEFTIRQGTALKLHEPEVVMISGTIDAPARWIEKRVDQTEQEKCHVLVKRDEMSIAMNCDENNYYGAIIQGRLQLSEEYRRFGINSGEYRTHFELAELIKMNRSYFENKTTAMKLVTELQNFKAKVDKEVEQSDNNRGDRRLLVSQAVKHNLPEAFTLVLPIFKGVTEQTIEVEVYVNPADLTCTLVSPEANDIVVSSRDALMNEVIERIQAVAPDVVIIEV